MAIETAEQLAQRAQNLGLIDEDQLRELWSELGTRDVGLDQFRQLLLRRERLTNYQVERIMAGHHAGFFYGNYKVLYLIGTGTFARVYRAAHKETNEQVAVKVLRKRFRDDAEQSDRFLREGHLGASLQHPNIVSIKEVAANGRDYYIVMEFVEGRNLREFVKIRKKFDVTDATRMTLDIAQGLAYASDKGVCHRDLKLSNVLVSVQGRAKLLDFGLAGADNTSSDEALLKEANPRTIDYAGLERATGVRKDDARSDIFFLGGMYYHMLSGVAPIVETKDRISRLQMSRFRDITPIVEVLPDIPPPVAAVVNKSMQFDPSRRYQTPAEMAAELRSVLARLEGKSDPGGAEDASTSGREGIDAYGRQRTVFLVEGDARTQQLLRDSLKKHGYRVLVTGDAERACERLKHEQNLADIVVFSSGIIGQTAIDCFNQLPHDPRTRDIPALLLLDQMHESRKDEVDTAKHRVAWVMPIKIGQLREILARLAAHTEEQNAQQSNA